MDITDIVREKSKLIFELQVLRKSQKRKDAINTASRAAVLESQIADHYFDRQDFRNAVISFTSEGSCLAIAERWREAIRVYRRALRYAENDKMIRWINAEVAKAEKEHTAVARQSAFSVSTNIEHNSYLRRPQIDAYIAAKNHFANHTEHAIIQLPVGCGKTGTMAILPFHISGGRVLVVAPNVEICKTLRRSLDYTNPDNFWKRASVLNNGHGPTCAILNSSANILDCDNSDFVVTNIQQLVANKSDKWLAQFPCDYFDMLCIDEGHHNVAPSWQQAIERFPKAKKISFTATPLRSDGLRVDGTRIYHFPIADAIREGYVKDISAHRLEPIDIHFTYKGTQQRHTLEQVMQLREELWFSKGVALSGECNRNIVDASITCMNELRQLGTIQHQIIAAACSIDHANSIRSLYAERGLAADVIHSKLKDDAKDDVLGRLKAQKLDVIVHVAMLGEGVDYPSLSVAAIFRPYRHLVPYIQFVGRIMRVVHDRRPGHPDNKGYVVSHFGLNIDRWWQELQDLDEDDKNFYQDVANGSKVFAITEDGTEKSGSETRRQFKNEMQVIDETIRYFIQSRFLPEDSKALVDDLLEAMRLRGLTPELFGVSRDEMAEKILESQQSAERRGRHEPLPVDPQRARIEARKRLDERVRSGAKQLLNGLGYSVVGFELVKRAPGSGTNNLGSAIILLNREVSAYLSVGAGERDTLSIALCQRAHDNMDEIIDRVIEQLKE